MPHPFFTIGHGTRPLEAFVSLLRSVNVTHLIDVRTVPRSRTNPQYNTEALPQSLAPQGIGYQHFAALGGLRGRERSVSPQLNGYWENDSFHNYADYAMGIRFREDLAALRELGHAQRCAIMCAETVWWRCHRRIITDYLLAAGETVLHILGPERIETAKLNEAAQIHANGTLTYPARQRDLFEHQP